MSLHAATVTSGILYQNRVPHALHRIVGLIHEEEFYVAVKFITLSVNRRNTINKSSAIHRLNFNRQRITNELQQEPTITIKELVKIEPDYIRHIFAAASHLFQSGFEVECCDWSQSIRRRWRGGIITDKNHSQ
jgi:hypothetical protein